jgi:hypothetical protein
MQTANIVLLGNYSLGNFTATSDGHGRTSVVDPPLSEPSDPQSALNQQVALWNQYAASIFPSDLSAVSSSAIQSMGGGANQLLGITKPLGA